MSLSAIKWTVIATHDPTKKITLRDLYQLSQRLYRRANHRSASKISARSMAVVPGRKLNAVWKRAVETRHFYVPILKKKEREKLAIFERTKHRRSITWPKGILFEAWLLKNENPTFMCVTVSLVYKEKKREGGLSFLYPVMLQNDTFRLAQWGRNSLALRKSQVQFPACNRDSSRTAGGGHVIERKEKQNKKRSALPSGCYARDRQPTEWGLERAKTWLVLGKGVCCAALRHL